MTWNAGVYSRGYASWSADAASNLPISATKFDTEDNDFAGGLNNCITKDGLSVPTSALAWGLASAQILALTRGNDGTVFSVARTGGANNPALQATLADATGITINSTFGVTTLAVGGVLALSYGASGLIVGSGTTGAAQGAGTINASGYYVNGVALPAYTNAHKPSATARSSTIVAADDPDLVVTLPSTGTYKLRLVVSQLTGGAGGLRLNTAGTATLTNAGVGTIFGNFNGTFTAQGGQSFTNMSIAALGASDWLIAETICQCTVAGTVKIQWAQQSSNVTATSLGANSILEATKIL